MADHNQNPANQLKVTVAVMLARLVSRCFWLFNRRFLYRIADFGGMVFYLLFPTYRNNVLSNLSHVTGLDESSRELRRLTRSAFRTSARNFADLTRVPHIPTDEFLESVSSNPGGLEILDKATETGRGAVLVTAHYGAFDYVGQILWLKGYKLTLLTARTVPEFIDAAVSYLRGSRGALLESTTPGGVRRVLTALKRGELIGIVADRDFYQNGKTVKFFGQETTLPPGPIRIARDAGAPVVAVLARRDRDGFYLHVEEPFMVPKTSDTEADIQKGLQRLVAIFEHHLRAAPDQWVMFQRVWTETPLQTIRVFPIGSPLHGKILGPSTEEHGPLTSPPEQRRLDPEPGSEERSLRAWLRRFANLVRQYPSGSS